MKLVSILSILMLPLFAAAQWKTMSVPTKANFRSVHAVNDQVAWIGGSLGSLYKTANGGETWNRITIPDTDSLDFRDVHGFNKKEAVVLSIGESDKGHSRIYKTKDGGLTWKLVHQPTKKGIFLDCIEFWDLKNGICLGDPVDGSFYILRTVDGGETWFEMTSSNPPKALKGEAAFAASGTSLHAFGKGKVVIGTGGNISYARILLSEDYGQNWKAIETTLPADGSSGVFGIHFLDSRNGIVVGGNYKKYKDDYPNILTTKDGGHSWSSAENVPNHGLLEAAGQLKNGTIVLVGHSGSSFSIDKAKTWHFIDKSPYHAASYYKNIGYAVGVDGLIKKYEVK